MERNLLKLKQKTDIMHDNVSYFNNLLSAKMCIFTFSFFTIGAFLVF